MLQRLVLFVGLLATAALLHPSSGTSCPSTCSRCPPLRISDCRAGIAREACGCCLVCAKALGETCGGLDGIYGTCGTNLTCISIQGRYRIGRCVPRVVPSAPPTTATSNPTSLPTTNSSNALPTTRAPASRNCLQVPKCNLSYCNDNRSKICRVNRTEILDEDENADFEFKPPCLITSCKACVFVEDLVPSEQSPCVSCEVDDEACMIAYGQCVMRYLKFITVKVSTATAYTREKSLCSDSILIRGRFFQTAHFTYWTISSINYAAIGEFTITQWQKGTCSVQGSPVTQEECAWCEQITTGMFTHSN